MRFIIASLLLIATASMTMAATDSLIIQGKILNFSGRLYRQGPEITFSRNNIFQPQAELSKSTEIQADGSFRVSLPLLYQQEEIYIDYSGLAFATFLASPGTAEITFNGDSLKTKGRLFYFAGVNAEANNRYRDFLETEAKILKGSPQYGDNFYKTFWEKDLLSAMQAAEQRAAVRKSALDELNKRHVPDATLQLWVGSIIEDERLQNMFEYALFNGNDLSTVSTLMNTLDRLKMPPLTAQRVSWANRFAEYADRKLAEKNYARNSTNQSLNVRIVASILRRYTPTLTTEEKTRLANVEENGSTDNSDINFMSRLFSRNESTVSMLFDYERAARGYGELFEKTALDFVKARYVPANFYKTDYKKLTLLGDYAQSKQEIPAFRSSLQELVALELRDSADIQKVLSVANLDMKPKEVLPGYSLAASGSSGVSWFNNVVDDYKGKTLYVIKWSMDDPKSRAELAYLPALRAQLGKEVEFIFLEINEYAKREDLWKQYIIRHHLQGIHLSLSADQAMDLMFRLNPIEPGTFAIIRPNGKFYAKSAPAPSDTQKVLQAIRQAR